MLVSTVKMWAVTYIGVDVLKKGSRWTEAMKDDILCLIGRLNTKKLLGPGGIQLRILKEFKCEVIYLLAKICKISLPSRGLEMRKCNTGYYRSVSLTSVPGKLVKTVVKDSIFSTSEQTLLRMNQHGFCKVLSVSPAFWNSLRVFYGRMNM